MMGPEKKNLFRGMNFEIVLKLFLCAYDQIISLAGL
jgi:hypothetical protein